jgi:hypothetical protein
VQGARLAMARSRLVARAARGLGAATRVGQARAGWRGRATGQRRRAEREREQGGGEERDRGERERLQAAAAGSQADRARRALGFWGLGP